MFHCAILCGGLATRLRPRTERIPKSLLTVCGEPFLAHQLRLLHGSGIRDVVLCTGFLGEAVEEYAGDGSRFGIRIRYSSDKEKLLGTAGAIRKALTLLSSSFFVVYGDSYLRCDYGAIAQAFEFSGRRGLMTIYRNDGQFDSSNVQAEAGTIIRYDKRDRSPLMRHIDYGLGVFNRSAFDRIPEGEPFDLARLYQILLAAGDLASYEVAERFFEIGSPEGIEELDRLLQNREKADNGRR